MQTNTTLFMRHPVTLAKADGLEHSRKERENAARNRNMEQDLEGDGRRRYHAACKVSVAMDTNVNANCIATCSTATCEGQGSIATALTNHTIAIYEEENLNKITTLKGHTKTITGLKFSKSDSSTLYSSSLDGTIRIWDLKQSRSVQQFQDDSDGKRKALSSFDVNCNETFIIGGTEAVITDALLLFWDVRSPKTFLGSYSESHRDDITQVRFHPEQPNTLASGSTDGLINIFDISQPCEDDALQNTLNTESSVDILRWYQRGRCIACLTHVETVQLWDVENVEITKSYDRDTIAKDLKLVLPPTQFLNLESNEETGLPTIVATCSDNTAILIEINEDCSLTSHCSLGRQHKSSLVCATWVAKDKWALTADESALLCLWKSGKKAEALR